MYIEFNKINKTAVLLYKFIIVKIKYGKQIYCLKVKTIRIHFLKVSKKT